VGDDFAIQDNHSGIQMTEERKTLALIAHDGKKADMVAFALAHKDVLQRYELVATSTTGQLLEEKCGLIVTRMLSGPQGGDAQIAAQVAEGKIEAVFFFVDPLGKHPHDPDIQGLLRICNAHNVPLASNSATAMYIISTQAL
jgi:methylglyoxal synthase